MTSIPPTLQRHLERRKPQKEDELAKSSHIYRTGQTKPIGRHVTENLFEMEFLLRFLPSPFAWFHPQHNLYFSRGQELVRHVYL
jgi:hypothetical protein